MVPWICNVLSEPDKTPVLCGEIADGICGQQVAPHGFEPEITPCKNRIWYQPPKQSKGSCLICGWSEKPLTTLSAMTFPYSGPLDFCLCDLHLEQLRSMQK